MTTETDLYVCSKAGECDEYNPCSHSEPHICTAEYMREGDCVALEDAGKPPECKCIPVPKEPEAGQEG